MNKLTMRYKREGAAVSYYCERAINPANCVHFTHIPTNYDNIHVTESSHIFVVATLLKHVCFLGKSLQNILLGNFLTSIIQTLKLG